MLIWEDAHEQNISFDKKSTNHMLEVMNIPSVCDLS
jgi:hypothetical protein